MSEQIDAVSTALVAAQGELEAATFDSQNPFLRNRYASLGAIIEASRPILAKHGLAIQQIPTTTADGRVSVETVIRHTSGQWLQGGVLSLPLGDEKGKSLAQVAGSIITYLKRYAWASNLGMYAEEDTDGNAPPTAKKAPGRSEGVSSTVPSPKNAPQTTPEPPKGTSEATPKYRMTALHRLLGAPGEANRTIVTHYLRSKGWITAEQEPEAWPLFCVPKSKPEMEALVAEVQAFEMQVRSQPEPELEAT